LHFKYYFSLDNPYFLTNIDRNKLSKLSSEIRKAAIRGFRKNHSNNRAFFYYRYKNSNYFPH